VASLLQERHRALRQIRNQPIELIEESQSPERSQKELKIGAVSGLDPFYGALGDAGLLCQISLGEIGAYPPPLEPRSELMQGSFVRQIRGESHNSPN
jgi:hypothetical protein